MYMIGSVGGLVTQKVPVIVAEHARELEVVLCSLAGGFSKLAIMPATAFIHRRIRQTMHI